MESIKISSKVDKAAWEELRALARETHSSVSGLLTEAIASEEEIGDVEPAEDLFAVEGMERRLAYLLAANGVVTREDLAELATDDLLEINADLDPAYAADLIMKARAHWFEDDDGTAAEQADDASAPAA